MQMRYVQKIGECAELEELLSVSPAAIVHLYGPARGPAFGHSGRPLHCRGLDGLVGRTVQAINECAVSNGFHDVHGLFGIAVFGDDIEERRAC